MSTVQRPFVIDADGHVPEPPVLWSADVVWASDYPHPHAYFRGAVTTTLESIRSVPPAARRKIFGATAARPTGAGV